MSLDEILKINKRLNNLDNNVEDLDYRFTKKTGSGSILNADLGSAGGYNLGTDYIRDKANSSGMASTITASDDVRFWAGASFANRGTAPFRVYESGAIVATSSTIGGWSTNTTSIYTGTEDHSAYTANAGDITLYSDGADASIHAFNWYIDTTGSFTTRSGTMTSVSINGIPNDTSTDISLLEWQTNVAYSVTDADTIAWNAHTITLSNARTFSISSGNTGNMAAKTYVYLDTAVSSTVLQTTTTPATAIGANKILLAVAQNATGEAKFMSLKDNQYNIDAANIVANSITANEIASSTITGTNILTMNISGKNATFDTGTIGGFTMSASTLSATNFTVTSGAANTANLSVGTGSNLAGLNSGNAAGDIAFWAGSTFANRATAPFRVTEAGAVTASNITITGGSVSDYQAFTSTGTWTKPTGAGSNAIVKVQLWGGGGGGGGSIDGVDAGGGAGGGGYFEAQFLASTLGATETVTIGAGGTAGTSSAGGDGGNTTFGTKATAYGGGGGQSNNAAAAGGGGGGGLAKGGTGIGGTGGNGGSPGTIGASISNDGWGGGGGSNGASGVGGNSGYGGGGGGSGVVGGAGQGGNSMFGGGGSGGGGAGPAAGGTSTYGGAGGAGKASGTGNDGTAPGGAGGGTVNANGGAGARGECRVTTIF